jgi:tRNA(Arg) A34 adenosine deaminase TadA
MRRALEIARTAIDVPGALPYAAVIVKDGRIVGEGLNRAVTNFDPTSHGEIEAIRDACVRLRTMDLSGCDLYTTAEPCPMCVATMYLSNIPRFYYASAARESTAFLARHAAKDPAFRRKITSPEISHEVSLPIGQRKMTAIQTMAADAHAIFEEHARRHGV